MIAWLRHCLGAPIAMIAVLVLLGALALLGLGLWIAGDEGV